MTPAQKIREFILRETVTLYWEDEDAPKWPEGVPFEQAWEAAWEGDYMHDILDEIREGEVETDVECDFSRHYESRSVAMLIDDTWIGWTYWYGGGKHGEPGAIDWIEDAYELEVTEEEKLVTIQTWKKKC